MQIISAFIIFCLVHLKVPKKIMAFLVELVADAG